MISPSELEERVRKNLPDVTHIEVKDLTGTQDHYEVTVVWNGFAGKSRIEQHQLVYKALGEWVGGVIHALALRTLTPDAWKPSREST